MNEIIFSYLLKEKIKTKVVKTRSISLTLYQHYGSYLSCWTASTIAVSSWISVKGSRVLLGCLHHPLCYWEIRGADVGSRQRPLIPRRLRAAISHHVTGLWPVVRLISVIQMLLKTNRVLLGGFIKNLEKQRSAACFSLNYI